MHIGEEALKEVSYQVRNFLSSNADISSSVGANSFHFFFTDSSGKEYVILIPKYKKVISDYKKQKILLPFLQQLNLLISTPTEIKIVNEDDITFAIEEKMSGHQWNYETYAKFTLEQKKLFAKQIASFLFHLHQTKTNNLPDCSFDDFFIFPDKGTFIRKLARLFTDEIKTDGSFIDKIYRRAKIIFDFGKTDNVFMHRDFHPQNTFIDDDGNLCGVIDWAACCIAPRIREFQNLAGTDNRELLTLVLEEYNTLAGTRILSEQVILFNKIAWISCLDILNDRPSLLSWAKKDGALLAKGMLDKQIKQFIK